MKQQRTFQLLVMAVICALLLIPVTSSAKEKTDFTGDWTLNESKSDLGEGRMFSTSKMTVKQEGNTIIIERTRSGRDGQERTMSETLTTDGKENTSKSENRSSTSTAEWSDDGTTLTIKSNMEFNRQGETFQIKRSEIWTLGEEGKILKIQSESSSSRGERSVTLVYDKQ